MFSGALDGFDDLVVAGAAAEVAGEVEADFFFAGCRVFFEQRFGLHDESRRADAALQSRAFEEGTLHFVEMVTAGDAFDRFQIGAFGFDGQDQATVDRPTVHLNGASSAVAVGAAFLRAGQAEHVAKSFEQCLLRLAEELVSVPVDRRGDDSLFRHDESACLVSVGQARPDGVYVLSFEQEQAEETEFGIERWLCSLCFLLLIIRGLVIAGKRLRQVEPDL